MNAFSIIETQSYNMTLDFYDTFVDYCYYFGSWKYSVS